MLHSSRNKISGQEDTRVSSDGGVLADGGAGRKGFPPVRDPPGQYTPRTSKVEVDERLLGVSVQQQSVGTGGVRNGDRTKTKTTTQRRLFLP